LFFSSFIAQNVYTTIPTLQVDGDFSQILCNVGKGSGRPLTGAGAGRGCRPTPPLRVYMLSYIRCPRGAPEHTPNTTSHNPTRALAYLCLVVFVLVPLHISQVLGRLRLRDSIQSGPSSEMSSGLSPSIPYSVSVFSPAPPEIHAPQ
jgi:hypothetical protein